MVHLNKNSNKNSAEIYLENNKYSKIKKNIKISN